MATRNTTQAGNVALAATWGGTLPVAGDTANILHACTQNAHAFPAVAALNIQVAGSLTITGTGNTLPNLSIYNGGRLVLSSGGGTVGNITINDGSGALSAQPIQHDGGTYTIGNITYTGYGSNGTFSVCRLNGGLLTVNSATGQPGYYASGFQAADCIHVYGGTLTVATARGGVGSMGYYGEAGNGGHGVRMFGGSVVAAIAYGGNGGDGESGVESPTAGGHGGAGIYASNPTSVVSITVNTQTWGGNGGQGGQGGYSYYYGGTGGNGGPGVYASGANVSVTFGTSAQGGQGGQGGNGGHAYSSYEGGGGGSGGHGGDALRIGAGVLLQSPTFPNASHSIRAGLGGSGGDNAYESSASGGQGGNSGNGLSVEGAPHADSYFLGKIAHGSMGTSGNSNENAYGSPGSPGYPGSGLLVSHASASLLIGAVAGSDWESNERGFYTIAGNVRPRGSISGHNAGTIRLLDGHTLSAGLVEWRLDKLAGTVNVSDAVVTVPGKFYFSAASIQKTAASKFVLANVTAQAMIVPDIPLEAHHDYPADDDVRLGVVYDDGARTGTLAVFDASPIRFR